MSDIILAPPVQEPPPAGKPSHKPIDATSKDGAALLRRQQRQELTRLRLDAHRQRYALWRRCRSGP